MTDKELIAALRRLRVQTGSITCMGCGYEHNCGTHGCRIVREAGKRLEELNDILGFARDISFPCDRCNTGWGIASTAGIDCCADTCKRLRAWTEANGRHEES